MFQPSLPFITLSSRCSWLLVALSSARACLSRLSYPPCTQTQHSFSQHVHSVVSLRTRQSLIASEFRYHDVFKLVRLWQARHDCVWYVITSPLTCRSQSRLVQCSTVILLVVDIVVLALAAQVNIYQEFFCASLVRSGHTCCAHVARIWLCSHGRLVPFRIVYCKSGVLGTSVSPCAVMMSRRLNLHLKDCIEPCTA